MQKKLFLITISLFVFSFSILAQEKPSKYSEKFIQGNYLILEENYIQALKSFLEAYQIDSSNSNINYKIGFCYLNTDAYKNLAIKYLEKAVKNTTKNYDIDAKDEKIAPVNAYYYYGLALHLNYKFDEAIANYEKFKSYLTPGKNDALIKDVERKIEISNNAKMLVAAPVNFIIKNLGDSINSAYPDYSAVISADEKILIFTSRRPGSTGGDVEDDGRYYEDIYISNKKDDNTWSTPKSISPNINTAEHEASVGLIADGQTLIIYKNPPNNGDLLYSTLDGENWTMPMPMGSDINTSHWETSASITPDGNTLYFISDRPGGIGKRDIWMCTKLPNGQWSKAANLGAPINTPDDEESPFIDPSGTTLFFSSTGHQTMGGFDIFYSYKNDNGTWGEPQNIGYPINTTDDDLYYVTSPDGKRGYFTSSLRAGGFGDKDIYTASSPEKKEVPLVLIKGLIVPAPGEKMPNDITIEGTNNESGQTSTTKPLVRDGSFVIIIPLNSDWTFSYQQNGEQFFVDSIHVPSDATYKEIHKELHLKPGNKGVPTIIDDGVTEDNNDALIAEKNTKASSKNKKGNMDDNSNEPNGTAKKGTSSKDKNQHNGEKSTDKNNGTIDITSKEMRHEQLAKVHKTKFEMYFKYNITEVDINDDPFKQYIDNLVDLAARNGLINFNIYTCASQVPTKKFKSNKDLSIARAEKVKEQLTTALKAKGIDGAKINFVKVTSIVAGPTYNADYLENKATYEKYQFAKVTAY